MNSFQDLRAQEKPDLPKILMDLKELYPEEGAGENGLSEIKQLFPNLANTNTIRFIAGQKKESPIQRVGVLFSGGQAAGGHNVIIGLFDALKKLNAGSELFGFLGGPEGLIRNASIKLNENVLKNYVNQGGFDLIGSGRTKIETKEQFEAVAKTVKNLKLSGLVTIGGDDSNTNAAFLAEYFIAEKLKTCVVGVPKTIDGDLKSDEIEIPFGFDTACKVYSDTIGSIARDALSAKKYYYFIKLMGRTASHITLECALQVHPNLAIIGEEVEHEKKTIKDLTAEICNVIAERAAQGKDFGIILIPEGLLEFTYEFKILIAELNTLLKKTDFDIKLLSKPSQECLLSLPKDIQLQILHARDPHGNVQVSKIDTERFFIDLVQQELNKRKADGSYSGKFSAQPIFCGYEGRSCFPSSFDCRYTYALGHVAALLIDAKRTGYMAAVQKLNKNVDDWQIAGIPLLSLMHFELRGGESKAVIAKSLVDLKSSIFQMFKEQREDWVLMDDYRYTGPILFFGPAELTDRISLTLKESLK